MPRPAISWNVSRGLDSARLRQLPAVTEGHSNCNDDGDRETLLDSPRDWQKRGMTLAKHLSCHGRGAGGHR